MNVLRMIKLFGWEPKINAQIAEKREEELVYIKKRQLLDLLTGTLKYDPYFMHYVLLTTFLQLYYSPDHYDSDFLGLCLYLSLSNLHSTEFLLKTLVMKQQLSGMSQVLTSLLYLYVVASTVFSSMAGTLSD